MASRLKRKFFLRPAAKVTQDVLGKYIVVNNKRAKIIETEAYVGIKDKASHSFGGKITPRNKIEYAIGGHIYIYLVYGMYWQLNITTGPANCPECFLIRAVDAGDNIKLTNGPGKLCRYLGLDKSFYGEDAVKSSRIWLENNVKGPGLLTTRRIGIDYAGPYWAKRKLRFLIKDYQKYLAKPKFKI